MTSGIRLRPGSASSVLREAAVTLLLLIMALQVFGCGKNDDTASTQSQTEAAVMNRARHAVVGERVRVPFVHFPTEQRQIHVEFSPSSQKSFLVLGNETVLPLPEPGIPVTVLESSEDRLAVFLKSIPENRLLLLDINARTQESYSLRVEHRSGIDPIFRAATLHDGAVYLVYYDNITLHNYVKRFNPVRNGYVDAGLLWKLPLLEDPAGGTYEMIPAVFAFGTEDGLHIFGGKKRMFIDSGNILQTERVESCLKVVEAVARNSGQAVLCLAEERTAAESYLLKSFGQTSPPQLDESKGVPWNLRWRGNELTVDHASSIQDLRRLLVFDLTRGQQSGFMEFGVNNVEGRVAWSQIYYLNGLLDIVRVAQLDAEMAQLFLPLIEDIRTRLDLEMSVLNDYWIDGWYQTRAFTVDRSLALFAVQTPRLLILMDRYLREVPNPLPLSGFESLRKAVRNLEGHIEEIATSGEPEGWIEPGKPYLRWPKGCQFPFDGVGVPFNHQNEWAYGVLETASNSFLPGPDEQTAVEIVQFFLEREAPNGNLPSDGMWNYWWGKAYDGWREADQVSVNRPSYVGAKGRSWISFRSIDAMAGLAAARYLDNPTAASLISSAEHLVAQGKLYPFVSYELLRWNRLPTLQRDVAMEYGRVSSPWEVQNAAWALRGLKHWFGKN